MRMVSFTLEQDFPAGLDRLWRILGHAAYVRAKYRAAGATALRLQRFEATPGLVEVALERELPPLAATRALPAWAASRASALRTLSQRSTWRREAAGEVQVDIEVASPGLPLRAHGTGTLSELAPGRCRLSLRWEASAGPALGPLRGVASALFARGVREALAQDHAFTCAYLARAPAGHARA